MSLSTTTKVVRYVSVALAATIFSTSAGYAAKASFDMPSCDRLSSSDPNSSAGPAQPVMELAPDADTGSDQAAGDSTTNSATSDTQSKHPKAKLTARQAKLDEATVSDDGKKPGKKANDKDAATAKKAKGDKGATPYTQISKDDLLKPLKLTDDSKEYSLSKDGKVKLKAEKDVTNKPDDTGATDAAMSNEAKLNNKLLKQAEKVKLEPLIMMESATEAQEKLDIVAEAEKGQLTELWSSTINRSPDIQFVIQRMQPHSDPNHATSTVIKLLSMTLFSAAQAVPMMMGPGVGTMGMYAGTGAGASCVQSLFMGQDAKNQKKQQISQEQATMLYKMVRDTADKLVIEYRNYKKCRSQYDRGVKLLEDIKAMVAAAHSEDSSEQIRNEYTIRKAQHDVDDITDDARLHRQMLSDMAGEDALGKLDDEIDQETTAVANATGGKADDPESADKVLAEKNQAAPDATTAPGAANAQPAAAANAPTLPAPAAQTASSASSSTAPKAADKSEKKLIAPLPSASKQTL